MTSTLAPHSNRAAVGIVADREIMSRLRDRTFIISAIFLLVVVAGSVTVPLLIQGRQGRPEYTVATVGDAAAALGRAAATVGDTAYAAAKDASTAQVAGSGAGVGGSVAQARLTLRAVPDVAAAEAAVRGGTADAALIPGSAGVVQIVADHSVPTDIGALVGQAQARERVAAAVAGSGVDVARVQAALQVTDPSSRLLDPNASQRDLALGLGFAFALLFFITVFGFGMSIAQSVVEEKQSRIVELLVTAVPVRVLLLGKVLGNTALALGQIVLLTAVGLAGASIAGQPELVTVMLRSCGWFVAFFLLGFVMLACLWAAAGALASRQEDLQSTTLPLQMLVMLPFFVSLYALDPSRWLTVLSYVPLTSPLVMPRRLAMGDASGWEAALSAGLVVVTAAAFVALGARLYEGALLRTRTRSAWREAWSRQS